MQEQLMVLVNEQDEPIGLMPKMQAHQLGVLHRAFSIFLFNTKGEMLLQQRAIDKYHSPSLWTNACCSHPYPAEDIITAGNRRLKEELGIATTIKKAFTFIYKADMGNGLVEHEYDHVFIGEYNSTFNLNSIEVAAVRYASFETIDKELEMDNTTYTAWFKIVYDRLKEYQLKTQQ